MSAKKRSGDDVVVNVDDEDANESSEQSEDNENDSEEVKDLKALGNPVLAAASTDLPLQALKALQIQVQKLIEENRTLHEENKVLVAEKPKHKHCTEAPNKLLTHEQTITLHARKYGMTVEMFPNTDLFSMQSMTQESVFLDELYQHFPSHLHSIMESSYFSDLVMKSISEARSSEINKLRSVVGSIFDLPGVYFSNTQYRRADITKIQKMLGVSAMNPKYKTFPPVLFLGMQEDPTLKTVFGNWELLAKILKAALRGVTLLHQETTGSIAWAAIIAIFLLSPDTEFQKSGTGKSSGINYKDLFFHYKKLLLTKWDSCCIQTIVQNIDREVFGSAKSSASAATQEDHSSEVIHAMNALNIDSDNESDISEPTPMSSAVQSTTAFQSDTVEMAQPPTTLSTVSSLSTTSTLSATFQATIQGDTAVPVATNTVVVQDANVEQPPARGRGRGRARAKKPAATGVQHSAHAA
ncbi:hypothetical protein EDB19DRAFT_1910854 [Suillus lakei]|nr:hypothetical protein EDB19DRAFT_1910854 [Suillus lakei]